MALALSYGRRAMGRVWPNPAVGCVIVKNGVIIGRGVTQDGGRPHAEVCALAQAGAAAKGATVYVTLEPCAHHGQTPPCAQALIDAQVARVVVALGDPDPRVDGGGLAMLRAAGIAVDTGVRADEAAQDHAGFLSRIQRGRPFVTLKMAGTLDGRIATASGESQWITGPEARRAVHMMRARHDAVMVGAGTVRADDPALTVRGLGMARQPLRVVVTGAGGLPEGAQLARTARDGPVWLCHGADAEIGAWRDQGVTSLPVASTRAGVDMADALRVLAERGITRVFCEGGGALAASLLSRGLVDQLVVFSAGSVIGAEGTAMLGAMGLDHLADAPGFTLRQSRKIGADICHIWQADV